jgi:hypothetical protein
MADLEQAAATLRAFAERTGARRVAALVDGGSQPAASLQWAPGEPVACVVGEEASELEGAAEPLALPELHPVAPVRADPATGEIRSRVGELEHLAGAVRALASSLPGRSVAVGEFATTDPAVALSIAARDGEPLVLGIGERQFQAAPGWPEDLPAAG